MKHGKLIVFEGISGTGKETQAKLLQIFLASKKIKSLIVFHPSPSLKPKLRAAKDKKEQIQLLVDDRKQNVQRIIKPTLAKKEWVLSLRNYVSAMVYQGDTTRVKSIDIVPDVLFYFDIDPVVSMKRIVSRGEERGMFEKINLLKEKRRAYKKVLKNIPHIVIDASKTIDEVHSEVVKYIV